MNPAQVRVKFSFFGRINPAILLSIAVITAAVVIAVAATFAFFSDTETSTGNNFTAGRLDLKINDQDDPEAIVFFEDLKPGDDYIQEKDLFVDFNPANVWLHLKGPDEQTPYDPVSTQGNQTEPEELEEDGVPQHDIENYIDYDLSASWEGDQNTEDDVIIPAEDEVPFTEVFSCWIPLGQIPGATHVSVSQSFHFDEEVTNWAQGDDLTWTEEFYASQINDPNGPPPTGSGRVWNPDTKRCEPPVQIACADTDAIFASSSSSNDQGLRKDNSAVLANRSDPSAAFGAPQTAGADSDVGFPAGSFFSLGFPLGGNTASIVFGFAEPFYNGPSADLQVYEVTGGVYPDEKVKIEASKDGTTWTLLAGSAIRDEAVDLGPLDFANFVRLTDVSTISDFPDDADGYDVDAVKALCTAVEE